MFVKIRYCLEPCKIYQFGAGVAENHEEWVGEGKAGTGGSGGCDELGELTHHEQNCTDVVQFRIINTQQQYNFAYNNVERHNNSHDEERNLSSLKGLLLNGLFVTVLHACCLDFNSHEPAPRTCGTLQIFAGRSRDIAINANEVYLLQVGRGSLRPHS